MTEQLIKEVSPVQPVIVQEPIKPDKNIFAELAAIDVGRYIEKKQQFSYLSWAWAVDQIKRLYPDTVIRVREYPEAGTGVMVPYLKTELGFFVQVDVTVNGKTEGEPFAVTDNRNKTILKPNNADINYSIQRAKVKSIAAHGLGLYIYAGEDVPTNDSLDYNQQQQAQNNYHQPQQSNPQQQQQPKMTEMQMQKMRELASNIAHLTSEPGSSKDVMDAKMKQIYNTFQITRFMTPEVADAKIMELQQALHTIHNQRIPAQQVQQTPPGNFFNNTPAV